MFKQLILFTLLLVLALTGCRVKQLGTTQEVQPSLLTYGQLSSLCSSGYVNSGQLKNDLRGYSIPLHSRYFGMEAQWHHASRSVILIDEQAILHQINLSDPGQFVDIELPASAFGSAAAVEGYNLSLSKEHELGAFMVQGRQVYGQAVIEGFGSKTGLWNPIIIGPVNNVALHPNELVVAGDYDSERLDQLTVSNVIALFDLEQSTNVPTITFRLNDYAIVDVFGWSSDSKIIAVSQTERMGVIPYFLFVQDGHVERSLFKRGCVLTATWSLSGHTLIYSGTGEEDADANWDLYLETVGEESSKKSTLLNLTKTATEDEITPSWSPEGNYIAYVKAFADETDRLWQDLFVIGLNDSGLVPKRLTTTPDEYETNPMWVSNTEIAYLSWVPGEGAWYLKRLSIADATEVSKTVLELPKSWYRLP